MVNQIKPEEFIRTCIKVRVFPSPVQGVGVFAIKDIKEGEEIFPVWEGLTGWYVIAKKDWKLVDEAVRELICDYNSQPTGTSKHRVLLQSNLPYSGILTVLVNSANAWEDVNIGHINDNPAATQKHVSYTTTKVREKYVAKKDIKSGDELLAAYLLREPND